MEPLLGSATPIRKLGYASGLMGFARCKLLLLFLAEPREGLSLHEVGHILPEAPLAPIEVSSDDPDTSDGTADTADTESSGSCELVENDCPAVV